MKSVRLAAISGPCGIWDPKPSSHQFRSDDVDVDLIYFEVTADNDELCGQAAIPLTCLRTGHSRLSRPHQEVTFVSSRHPIGSIVR